MTVKVIFNVNKSGTICKQTFLKSNSFAIILIASKTPLQSNLNKV